MRAAIRTLKAISIITVLLLFNRELDRVGSVRDCIHISDSRLLPVNGPQLYGGKEDNEHKTPQGDGVEESASTIASTAEIVTSLPLVPETQNVDQIVVVGYVAGEDIAWLNKLDNWRKAIYSIDNQSFPLHTPANKGRESSAYLTYITQNYAHLPEIIAFIHPHESGYPSAWHTDTVGHSNVQSLTRLNTAFVQRNGYANTRCMFSPGCPDEIQPFREPVDEHRTAELAFSDAWRYIFEDDDVPHVVATPCCAQFAVSRSQILRRPAEFYERALGWLMETHLSSHTSGCVMEYLWHVIFGQEPVYCPEQWKCYNDVYGQE